MKKFAMLGKWHVHAEGYAKELMNTEGCAVVKVWDPDAAAANEWARSIGCESASVEEILADPEIEGVVVCNATNEHTDLIVAACNAGKAVFTEKVLALTTAEALKIKAAVEANNTRFGISFPHLSEAPYMFALATAKAGKLGEINYARMRKAHNGATADWLPPHFYDPIACGGGAMIDLGAHPMYLLCELYGKLPEKVQSSFTKVTGKAVEDNAVSLLTFEGGAIGVSETGFLSTGYPLVFEIGGTTGTLMLAGSEVKYCCPETDNKWTVAELPERLPSPLVRWAKADKPEDIDSSFGIDAGVRLTQVMEMAYAE